DWSLLRVMDDLDRPVASPVRVEAQGASGGGPVTIRPGESGPGAGTDPASADPAAVTAAIQAQAATAHSVAIGQTDVSVPGLAALQVGGLAGEQSYRATA